MIKDPHVSPSRAPFLLLLALLAAPAATQTTAPPTYDPRITFAPLTLPQPVNSYRSGSGAPGPAYWQNEADYAMHANLNPVAKVLTNDEIITYTNNSPDTLPSLWILLEQNSNATLFDILEDIERRIIIEKLERSNWNQTEAADQFHIPLSTLNQKIKRLNIEIRKKGRE